MGSRIELGFLEESKADQQCNIGLSKIRQWSTMDLVRLNSEWWAVIPSKIKSSLIVQTLNTATGSVVI